MKKICKVIFNLGLSIIVSATSLNYDIVSFAVSDEAIFNDMVRHKSLIDCLC